MDACQLHSAVALKRVSSPEPRIGRMDENPYRAPQTISSLPGSRLPMADSREKYWVGFALSGWMLFVPALRLMGAVACIANALFWAIEWSQRKRWR